MAAILEFSSIFRSQILIDYIYISSRTENRYKPFVNFFWGWGGISTRLYSCVNILAAILDAILNIGKGSSGNHGEF